MIRARELFPRSGSSTESEKARLEALEAQIQLQPLEERQLLAQELLDLVGDEAEPLRHRTLSAFIIAAHTTNLNLVGSKSAIGKLTSAIGKEPILQAGKERLVSDGDSSAGFDAARFSLVLALVRAMLAVERNRGCKYLRALKANTTRSDFREILLQLEKTHCA